MNTWAELTMNWRSLEAQTAKPRTVFGLREQGAMLTCVDNLTAALADLGLVRESELYEIGRSDVVAGRHSETLRRFGYYTKGWTATESGRP